MENTQTHNTYVRTSMSPRTPHLRHPRHLRLACVFISVGMALPLNVPHIRTPRRPLSLLGHTYDDHGMGQVFDGRRAGVHADPHSVWNETSSGPLGRAVDSIFMRTFANALTRQLLTIDPHSQTHTPNKPKHKYVDVISTITRIHTLYMKGEGPKDKEGVIKASQNALRSLFPVRIHTLTAQWYRDTCPSLLFDWACAL